jgi:peptidoglycan hydrolase-like protein with peptidoglycan-binding domain
MPSNVNVRAPTPEAEIPADDAAAAPAALRPSAATPPEALNVADAAPRVPMGQYPPPSGLPLGREQLTREIQVQLKRAGCYHGTIDGEWSVTVRRSMKAFTDRANATLSVARPHIVLLAMLQNHQGGGCGVPCPPGQGLAADGRCLPNGLIVGIAEKLPAGSIPAATASPSVGQTRGNEAPMSLAGPPLPPATPAGQPASEATSAKAGRRHASPPVGAVSSSHLPRWAAHAFESR